MLPRSGPGRAVLRRATFSASPRPARKSPRCSAEFLQRWVTSPRSRPIWVRCRSASPRPRRDPSPRFRRSTFPPTISRIPRPRPRLPISTPPRCSRARSRRRAFIPPWTRSTRHRACSRQWWSAKSITISRARCSGSCSVTRRSRTSSPSSAWTSSRKRTSSRSRARARSSAICRSPSTLPKSLPAPRACLSSSPTPFAVSRACAKEKYDYLPEAAFYMVGTIEQAVEKGKKLAAEAA